MTRILLLAITLALASCPATPVVPTPDAGGVDAGGAEAAAPRCSTPATCACQRLEDLDCSEAGARCIEVVEQILAQRLVAFDADCVARATTKEGVRLCPAIECP